MTRVFVIAILAAIIAANLSSAHFGAEASIYNAFLMIGLVISARDHLHDAWRENRLRNMALLIASGSALSFAAAHLFLTDLPPDIVARIALASCAAFAVAESFDAVLYHLIRRRPWLERSNTSNLLGAVLDSTVFVSIAFGWTWEIIFAQVCAKIAGGFVWSLLIGYTRNRRDEPEQEPEWKQVHRRYWAEQKEVA